MVRNVGSHANNSRRTRESRTSMSTNVDSFATDCNAIVRTMKKWQHRRRKRRHPQKTYQPVLVTTVWLLCTPSFCIYTVSFCNSFPQKYYISLLMAPFCSFLNCWNLKLAFREDIVLQTVYFKTLCCFKRTIIFKEQNWSYYVGYITRLRNLTMIKRCWNCQNYENTLSKEWTYVWMKFIMVISI